MIAQLVHWGVVGPVAVAECLCAALQDIEGARFSAVAGEEWQALASSGEGGESMKRQLDLRRIHGTAEAVASDGKVRVVLVAEPLLAARTRVVLEMLIAGKDVLVVPPLASTREEACEVVETARSCGRLLVECISGRFFPCARRAQEIMKEGSLGSIVRMRASLGRRCPGMETEQMLDENLPPLLATAIEVEAERSEEAGDEKIKLTLTFGGAGQAVLTASGSMSLQNDCVLCCTKGTLTLHPPFWAPERMLVAAEGHMGMTLHFPVKRREGATGIRCAAQHVHSLLAIGECESSLHPVGRSKVLAAALQNAKETLSSTIINRAD